MNGFVFLMIGGREGQVGQSVKGHHAIGLGIVNKLAIAAGFNVALSGLPWLQVPRPKPNSGLSHISTAPITSHRPSPISTTWVSRCSPVSSPHRPRSFRRSFRNRELIAGAAVIQCGERGLGGHHAGLHGVVRTFDARHIHKAGGTADEHAAGEIKFGHGLKAAFGDGAGAIGNTPSASRTC